MSINRSRLLGLVCVLATLSIYGCDDNDTADDGGGSIGPSRIAFSGIGEPAVNSVDFFAHGVSLQPAVPIPQPVTGAACPTRPPFQIPFTIVGSGNGRSDLFVDEVQMRFVDRAGVVGGAMTMASAQLAERFGSTHLPAVGTRSFPFTLPFGCVGLAVGTLQVGVLTEDSLDRQMRTSLSIDVR